jgi:hypothetical protein
MNYIFRKRTQTKINNYLIGGQYFDPYGREKSLIIKNTWIVVAAFRQKRPRNFKDYGQILKLY